MNGHQHSCDPDWAPSWGLARAGLRWLPVGVFIMRLQRTAAALFVLVSAPLLGAIHLFVYSVPVSLYLYQIAGGITQVGRWTQYGGAPFAWTIPLQLPGILLLSREKLGPSVYTIANVLVLAASIA